jgi:hypothetical protein
MRLFAAGALPARCRDTSPSGHRGPRFHRKPDRRDAANIARRRSLWLADVWA